MLVRVLLFRCRLLEAALFISPRAIVSRLVYPDLVVFQIKLNHECMLFAFWQGKFCYVIRFMCNFFLLFLLLLLFSFSHLSFQMYMLTVTYTVYSIPRGQEVYIYIYICLGFKSFQFPPPRSSCSFWLEIAILSMNIKVYTSPSLSGVCSSIMLLLSVGRQKFFP